MPPLPGAAHSPGALQMLHGAAQRPSCLPDLRGDDRHGLAGVRAHSRIELLGEACDLHRRPPPPVHAPRRPPCSRRCDRGEGALDGRRRRRTLRSEVLAHQLLDLVLKLLDGFHGHAAPSQAAITRSTPPLNGYPHSTDTAVALVIRLSINAGGTGEECYVDISENERLCHLRSKCAPLENHRSSGLVEIGLVQTAALPAKGAFGRHSRRLRAALRRAHPRRRGCGCAALGATLCAQTLSNRRNPQGEPTPPTKPLRAPQELWLFNCSAFAAGSAQRRGRNEKAGGPVSRGPKASPSSQRTETAAPGVKAGT